MRHSALLAACITSLFAATAQAAPPVKMTPATQHDVRCFMLFAAAVNEAQKAENDKAREASGFGVMYYFGKLTSEAPSLNVVDAVVQEAALMAGNPGAKDIGAACDAEFSKGGQQLVDIGQKLKQAGSQSASPSK